MTNLLVSLILLIVCISSASGLYCYYCSNCPTPFNPYSSSVRKVQSVTGYCMKQSYSSYPGDTASRGGANPGLCYRSGCTTGSDTSGQTVYYCCCRSDYCNTGSFTSKSTITVLLSALALLAINRYA